MNYVKMGLLKAGFVTVILFYAINPIKTLQAADYIFWTCDAVTGTDFVGRANIDGTDVRENFITGADMDRPWGVDVNDNFVYWPSNKDDVIGRANIDGSGINYNLGPTKKDMAGISVDLNYMYFSEHWDENICRANLDGSNPDYTFITGINRPFGLKATMNNLYWASQDGNSIGRANIDGSDVIYTFIGGCNNPTDVTAQGAYIYWVNNNTPHNSIGRAGINGDNVNQYFITGCNGPTSIEVTSNAIYWTNQGNSTIGRANLDGTGVNQNFISGLSSLLYGLTVLGNDNSLPVTLSSFSATSIQEGVELAWTTQSETDNAGFIVERKSDNTGWLTIASWQTHDGLQGQGNCSCATDYTYTDMNVKEGNTYSYKLSDVDLEGTVSVKDVISITLDDAPELTELLPASPNPFNPSTKIQYTLTENSNVTLNVINMKGQTVQTIISDQNQTAGSYSVHWNGQNQSGINAPSGLYLLVLHAGQTVKSQKVMLMR